MNIGVVAFLVMEDISLRIQVKNKMVLIMHIYKINIDKIQATLYNIKDITLFLRKSA